MLGTIGIAMLIAGGVLVLGALALMVVWKVPSLIDEISGKKAKRLIQRMKNANVAVSGGVAGSVALVGISAPIVDIPTNNIPTSDVYVGSGSGTGSVLNKLVNDPYGTVGGKKRVETPKVANFTEVKTKPSGGSPANRSVTNIVEVIEEQSSVLFN